jgi:hypothetical protein
MAITTRVSANPSGNGGIVAFTAVDSGYSEIVAAQTGRKIRVTGFSLILSGTTPVDVYFASASTAIYPPLSTAPITLDRDTAAGVPGLFPSPNDQGFMVTAAGEALRINLSAGSVEVAGHVNYVLE